MPFIVPALGAIAGVASAQSANNANKKALGAQKQVAADNNALARETRAANTANFQPTMDRGALAGRAEADLLGLGGDPAAQEAAFQRFRDSTGYQFQMDEAQRGINTGLGASNALLSGRRLSALSEDAQGRADSGFSGYYDRIRGVADRGYGAAAALAGVNTAYGQQVAGNNRDAADARSNAALVNGQNTSSLWSGIGSILGSVAGQSSFAAPRPNPTYTSGQPIYANGGVRV